MKPLNKMKKANMQNANMEMHDVAGIPSGLEKPGISQMKQLNISGTKVNRQNRQSIGDSTAEKCCRLIRMDFTSDLTNVLPTLNKGKSPPHTPLSPGIRLRQQSKGFIRFTHIKLIINNK